MFKMEFMLNGHSSGMLDIKVYIGKIFKTFVNEIRLFLLGTLNSVGFFQDF